MRQRNTQHHTTQVATAYAAIGAVAFGITKVTLAGTITVTAKQAFAIGLLAYNFSALVVAPIAGIAMQPVGGGTLGGNNPLVPKPQPLPKHPSSFIQYNVLKYLTGGML